MNTTVYTLNNVEYVPDVLQGSIVFCKAANNSQLMDGTRRRDSQGQEWIFSGQTRRWHKASSENKSTPNAQTQNAAKVVPNQGRTGVTSSPPQQQAQRATPATTGANSKQSPQSSSSGNTSAQPKQKKSVLAPVNDPHSPQGLKERQRRTSIDGIADQLEEGRFRINPNDSDRVRLGKNTAIEALRDAKNPAIGLIRANNDKGAPVGFLSFKPRNRHLEIVHVGSDQTTKGAGRTMFNNLIQEAKSRGKGIIVSAERDAAGFYLRMGMRRIGDGDDFELSADEVKAFSMKNQPALVKAANPQLRDGDRRKDAKGQEWVFNGQTRRWRKYKAEGEAQQKPASKSKLKPKSKTQNSQPTGNSDVLPEIRNTTPAAASRAAQEAYEQEQQAKIDDRLERGRRSTAGRVARAISDLPEITPTQPTATAKGKSRAKSKEAVPADHPSTATTTKARAKKPKAEAPQGAEQNKDSATTTPDTVLQTIKRLDQELGTENYVPIFKLREALPNVSRKDLNNMLYQLQREDRLDLSTLVESIHYTPKQIKAGIPQDAGGPLFFLIVNHDNDKASSATDPQQEYKQEKEINPASHATGRAKVRAKNAEKQMSQSKLDALPQDVRATAVQALEAGKSLDEMTVEDKQAVAQYLNALPDRDRKKWQKTLQGKSAGTAAKGNAKKPKSESKLTPKGKGESAPDSPGGALADGFTIEPIGGEKRSGYAVKHKGQTVATGKTPKSARAAADKFYAELDATSKAKAESKGKSPANVQSSDKSDDKETFRGVPKKQVDDMFDRLQSGEILSYRGQNGQTLTVQKKAYPLNHFEIKDGRMTRTPMLQENEAYNLAADIAANPVPTKDEPAASTLKPKSQSTSTAQPKETRARSLQRQIDKLKSVKAPMTPARQKTIEDLEQKLKAEGGGKASGTKKKGRSANG